MDAMRLYQGESPWLMTDVMRYMPAGVQIAGVQYGEKADAFCVDVSTASGSRRVYVHMDKAGAGTFVNDISTPQSWMHIKETTRVFPESFYDATTGATHHAKDLVATDWLGKFHLVQRVGAEAFAQHLVQAAQLTVANTVAKPYLEASSIANAILMVAPPAGY